MAIDLTAIHNELLGQLADIIRVCEKHDIPWMVMHGTLLGAVRHKGFIPWDDDVDLTMTRAAFRRFEKAYQQEHDEKYLLSYTNTWTPRVMSKDPVQADAFTDIFIMDYLPEGALTRKWTLLRLRLLQGMMKQNVDYSRFNAKQKALLAVTHVMGLPFSRKWMAERYRAVSEKCTSGAEMFMSNAAFGLLSLTWEPALFDKQESAPFEGLTVRIPVRWAEILTILFGPDYMTPPPESERVAKHLDL